jgi:hypothetical protein
MRGVIGAAAAVLLAGCVSTPPPPAPGDVFFGELRQLCGRAFAGRLESNEAADAQFAGKPLVVGAVQCPSASVVRMPFAVGEDRSRTWVVTRLGPGRLRLKHDHRHADGTEDVLSQYGGATETPGTATRQEFPADEFSRDLFVRRNLPRSLSNIWALELKPGQTLAYELNRSDRHFRVAFDLTRPM